jgi:adenosine/AMP kinase
MILSDDNVNVIIRPDNVIIQQDYIKTVDDDIHFFIHQYGNIKYAMFMVQQHTKASML